jgi:hypothetical protein
LKLLRGQLAAFKGTKLVKDLAALALIAAATITTGILNGSFTGFPKGYDAYGHMSKIKLLVDYFPNVDWNYEWYSGMLYSLGSFPPLFHYMGGVLVALLGASTATALIFIAAISFVLIGWGLYGSVRVATGDHVAALVAALVLIGSPAYWTYIVEDGLYPRILGMAFTALFSFFAIFYYKLGGRLAYVAMVLSLAAALSSHLLVGAIAVAFAVVTIAALPQPVAFRVREALKVLVPTALVVAYFYLPYAQFIQRPASVPLFTRTYIQMPLSALFIPGTPGAQFESLPFFVVPAVIVLPLVGFAIGRRPREPWVQRGLAVVALAGAASLVYAFVGFPAPSEFIYNFQPGQALFFAAWYLAAFIGIALSALKLPRLMGGVLVVALLAFAFITAPAVALGAVAGDNAVTRQLQASLNVNPSDRQFRVGVSWDGGSEWINSQSDVPQTRGYQQQGVLYPDWQYYLETAVWNPLPNYDEKNFLLDWYAIRSLYGGPDPGVAQRFQARPDLYAAIGSNAGGGTFQYANSTPILSARSTRTALVIGSNASYTLVVKALALSGFDSRSLIPVRGGEYLDDHSAVDLAQFDEVILYGFSVHDPNRALALLRDYVQAGGGVVMEANNSPFEATGSAQEPIPGTQIQKTGIGPAWNFESRPSPVTSGIDFAAFAPATYQGGLWGISFIPPGQVSSWANPLLLSDGRPVLVAGALGRGRVVWSGMNLPYHVVSNQAEAESRLLSQEITWVSPGEATSPTYSADFVNPQLSRVTIASPAKGVLFKESWFANWHASVNGMSAGVYRAGPDFMYVPLGKEVTYPASITLEFTPSALERVSDAISALTLVGLLIYAVVGGRRVRSLYVRSRGPQKMPSS